MRRKRRKYHLETAIRGRGYRDVEIKFVYVRGILPRYKDIYTIDDGDRQRCYRNDCSRILDDIKNKSRITVIRPQLVGFRLNSVELLKLRDLVWFKKLNDGDFIHVYLSFHVRDINPFDG